MPAHVGSQAVLIVLRPTRRQVGPREVRDRLDALYKPLFPRGRAWSRWDQSQQHVIAGFQLELIDTPDEALTVWGLPVGASGDATDAELLELGASTDSAKALLGTWVVVLERPTSTRLVTSNDLVHTLVRASGPDGVAYATKGLAALVATGAPLQVARDRIAELVLLDYVLGDDELLEGTTVLPEASVVDLDAAGDRVRSYWSIEERFAPGPPTTPQRLREVLSEDLRRLAAVDGAHVALTAGRDSTLVASCLADQGLALPTFTMGDAAFPDALGAAAVAAAWGVSHRCTPPLAGTPDFRGAVDRAVWTEGMDTGWNLVGAGLRWDGPEPIVWLGGSGGEIGRAFYWAGAGQGTPRISDLVDAMLPWTAKMSSYASRRLKQRAAEAIASAAETTGRTGWASLDVVYARGRMRKWLMRTMPRPEARGLLAAFTGPEVVRALLDVPKDDRRSGAAFDRALALGTPNLHEIARSALPVASALQPGPTWRRTVARFVPATLLDRRHRPAPQPVAGPLAAVLSQLGDAALTRAALGDSWWDTLTQRRGAEPGPQHQLWNAVAVEGLTALLHRAPGSR